MTDRDYKNHEYGVLNLIDDSVLSMADTVEVILTGKLFCSAGSRVKGQTVDDGF